MTTDYINREAAIKACKSATDPYEPISHDIAIQCAVAKIKQVPAADVRPVVHSRWIYHEDDYGDYYECANCHDEYVVHEGDMTWKF